MDYIEAKEYLLSPEVNTSILGLERIKQALNELGNPQKGLKVVHVVGSNGKGSTSAMIAGILKQSGMKCGLFTSPYISELTEYIKLDMEDISCTDFAEIAEEVRLLIESKNIRLTHFEFITVMSVLYFKRNNCELCIYEAGMGGIDDATNIFDEAVCNVLCSITVEHSQWLGNSIKDIIENKLGISHQNEMIIASDIQENYSQLTEYEETGREIISYCKKKGFRLFGVDNTVLKSMPDKSCLKFDCGNITDLTLNTGAIYQLKNAATAIKACKVIGESFGKEIHEDEILMGLELFGLKSRFELISDNPEVIVDGGHNPACIKELIKSLSGYNRYIIVTGVMADKDFESMYELLAPYTKVFITVDDGIKRAVSSDILAEKLRKYKLPVYDAGTCEIAAALVHELADEYSHVLFTGTLYMTDSFKSSFKAFGSRNDMLLMYNESVNRLTGKSFYSANYGLEDVKRLLENLGSPEKQLKVIHVAGTNGKGSTCKMLHSIIRHMGYSCGLFTSPYIRVFNERIQVNENNISDCMLTALTNRVLTVQQELGIDLNQFALVTVIAFLYYRMMDVDYVVLETGLGGEFDPTNVIEKPLCTVIANIGLDHVGVLGDDICKIASAKAGIIKHNVPNVCYPVEDNAYRIISEKCVEKSAALYHVKREEIKIVTSNHNGTEFLFRGEAFHVALNGDFQAYNACVAISAIKVVFGECIEITCKIREGLRKICWPGRLELISEEPLCFMDGGHNPQCISTVTSFFDSYYVEYKKIFIAGFMKDKDYLEMLRLLSSSADRLFLVPIDCPRAMNVLELSEVVNENIIDAEVFDDLNQAYFNALALDEKKLICFIGSLYQLNSIYELLEK